MTVPRTSPERSGAESARLLEEKPWVAEALAAMRDGVLILDEHARVAHANPAANAMAGRSGLSDDPTLWATEHGLFLADEETPYPTERLPLWSVLRGDTVRDVELFVRNARVPQGVHVAVSGSPLRDGDGRVRGAVLVFRDTTERRGHERRLVEGEQKIRAILDNIPDIAWLKGTDGRYVAVNRRLAETAGRRSPDELIGLTDHDLWPADLAASYRAVDLEVMATRRPVRLEEQLVDAAGRTYWVETVKTAIVGPTGAVIGTTGIARDVTERREVEHALRQMNDELERRVEERTAELAEVQENLVRQERLAVLGQLAGGVAHQIRNPLAAIMNATYVLKRHVAPDLHSNVEDALRIIHDEVRHANSIITGLLDFARVRSPDRNPASIVEIVDRVLASEVIPERVVVERHVTPVPAVDVDVGQIQGALANVVRNAVEAMPDGGTLRVQVSAEADQVVVAVSDTGAGISPQIRAHLFEPLRSTKPLGIGLGLVTARTILEGHGGRIAMVDVPRGARFEMRLPVSTTHIEDVTPAPGTAREP